MSKDTKSNAESEADNDEEVLYEVEKILKKRKNPKTGKNEYFLKWKGFTRLGKKKNKKLLINNKLKQILFLIYCNNIKCPQLMGTRRESNGRFDSRIQRE